jgi:hypothetical protein
VGLQEQHMKPDKEMIEYKKICINSLHTCKHRCDNYRCNMFLQEHDRENAVEQGKFITYLENHNGFSMKCNDFIKYVLPEDYIV